ncbi:haloacid dehalogenase [Acrocarpospora pleiomorpha]|uniref:Haloacid dehalogenase n=1 Tax=Acrocarpospora pleiomorpha TaxID=90975 RepID=A0A5M3XGP5_9ACTN|nr:HAD family phosphatase [Acrocarpospora pleiomorpha]GES19319.1 haloacid dehalogenase [Acrocarpospora pleiomorpha]
MRWIIFDFAGVVGRHQPHSARDGMVAVAGVESDRFWAAYWEHRDPYDRGLMTAGGFWSAVEKTLEADFTAEVAGELIRLDITSWLNPDMATVELVADLKSQGLSVALLSNAPHELADALDDVPWMADLEHRFFSSRMAISKPSPEIYKAVLSALDARPAECVFIDDRPPNVTAAETVGMHALLFTDAARLRADLDDLLRGN